MENRRFLLIALFGAVLFFIYQAWQNDYPPASAVSATPATASVSTPSAKPVDEPASGTATVAATETAPGSGGATATADANARIRVETDLYVAEIAPLGGELRHLELKDYRVAKDKPEALALLDDRNGRYFVLQSGLAGTASALITHETSFTSAQSSYVLEPGQDSLEVVLEHQGSDGLTARKIYRFKRDSYEIGLEQTLRNDSAAALAVSPYVRLVRTDYKQGGEPKFSATFTGVGFYQQSGDSYKFKKTKLKDLDGKAFELQQKGGWISILQHYFVTAIVPPADEAVSFAARPSKTLGYNAQYVGSSVQLAPGSEQSFPTQLYIGPKLQDRLEDVAPGFELTLDYGILTALAKPIFWLLKHFHNLLGNWGWSIIFLTIVVKSALFKLSEAQYRSMAKMKVFGPKIQEIRDRYADDRERQQKAMMDLYKKEGFNPLAGCWPILVQFPVFIALYWVLLESVEMRQASFMWWIQDLSAPDPYYVLPVVYGLTMFLQQKMSGTQTADPMQQRVMQMMPIFLTAFFTFFQSGLVLYWVVNGLISISQQWYITRKLAHETTKKQLAAR